MTKLNQENFSKDLLIELNLLNAPTNALVYKLTLLAVCDAPHSALFTIAC